ncbi:hypothetical protein BDR26DRAFT_245225 [Obelidium mucronatum]|nr:hypothetical protein BDR26DRAFT_245225 [Obelidium mucronatum]
MARTKADLPRSNPKETTNETEPSPVMKPPSPLRRRKLPSPSPLKRKRAIQKKDASSRSYTTPQEFAAMISWLEVPKNFALITGGAGKGAKMKSGQSLKRTDAYKQLAEFVCQQCKCNWDAKILKNRFNAWITRYKKARSDADQTGFGVTETDVNRGIETIEEKLEHMCPQYSRLDKLYGERVNINPVAVAECGVGESDDDDNQSVENDKDDDSDSAGSQDEMKLESMKPVMGISGIRVGMMKRWMMKWKFYVNQHGSLSSICMMMIRRKI